VAANNAADTARDLTQGFMTWPPFDSVAVLSA